MATLMALIAKWNLKWLPYVLAVIALISVGALANGYRWGEKYNAREIDWKQIEIDRQVAINAEWLKVAELQDVYTKLNKETYDDLRKKLDVLADSVESYGTRTVRVCTARPLVVSPTKDGVPAPAPGVHAAPRDGRGGAVEPDTRQSWSPEGYDIFPEVTALMARSDEQAITCNQRILWEEKRP